MARLNIEDEFWVDVGDVAAKIGNLDIAIGQAVRLFKLAQEKAKTGARITVREFEAKFNKALIPVFASVDGDLIDVTGANKHFSWLASYQEAGRQGGLVSAKRPRDEKGRLLPKDQASPSDSKHVQARFFVDENNAEKNGDLHEKNLISNVVDPTSPSTSKHSKRSQASISISNTNTRSCFNKTLSSSTEISAAAGGAETAVAVTAPSAAAFDAKDPAEVFGRLATSTKKRWTELYPNPEWLLRTAKRAIGYYLDNPKKKPKSARGWAQAISAWLEKDWSQQARFEKGRTNAGIDWQTVFGGKDEPRDVY